MRAAAKDVHKIRGQSRKEVPEVQTFRWEKQQLRARIYLSHTEVSGVLILVDAAKIIKRTVVTNTCSFIDLMKKEAHSSSQKEALRVL